MSNNEFEAPDKTNFFEELSKVMVSRAGKKLSDLMESEEPLVDLHTMLYAVSPRELLDAVNAIVYSGQFTLHVNTFTHFLSYNLQYGTVHIETATPQFAWNENSATQDLIISVVFDNMVFNDPKRINKLNFDYPTIQLSTNQSGKLTAKSFQTLKGGRTTENLLWTIIHFFQDTDRLYRDICYFDKD